MRSFSLYVLNIYNTAFVIVLFGLFYTNIGTIDLTIDIMTMLSLLSVVPLTYFYSERIFTVETSREKVLILEEETGEIRNKVDALLLIKSLDGG